MHWTNGGMAWCLVSMELGHVMEDEVQRAMLAPLDLGRIDDAEHDAAAIGVAAGAIACASLSAVAGFSAVPWRQPSGAPNAAAALLVKNLWSGCPPAVDPCLPGS
jgi:hypothetical protein